MPIYLDKADVVPELAGFPSVLIVPCRFCPAASMAIRTNEPYIELFRSFPKTDADERLIDSRVEPDEKPWYG